MVSGTYPIEARDLASTVYRITSEQPAPLPEIVPGCPPVLDDIVSKAIATDRDLRYQSFTDLLLDLQPVLLDLQKEKSSELLSEANAFLKSGQTVQAQSVARELLKLDPRDQEARKLLELVQQSLQQLSVQDRIEANLKAVDDLIEGKLFPEAISSLESALALFPKTPNSSSDWSMFGVCTSAITRRAPCKKTTTYRTPSNQSRPYRPRRPH